VPRYDVIIAGVGAMGSATAFELARRGKRVLALERFDIPHNMGSSHGANRIIRLAYAEGPAYVPLLRRALSKWREAEQLGGEQLLYVTGTLDIGPRGGELVEGAIASARKMAIHHEILSPKETMQRFPGYHIADDAISLYQPDGGFVASERSIITYANLAIAHGADVRAREPITSWRTTPEGGVRVDTPRGIYEADSLVLSVGAWLTDYVPALKTHANAERQVMGWFRPKRPELFQLGRFPCGNISGRLVNGTEGHIYQFPMWGLPGVKFGMTRHVRAFGHANDLSRVATDDDEAHIRAGVETFFPEANGPLLGLRPCLYTTTTDGHFIIDRLPDAPNVIVASPCSGHGFKFASVMGEVLADLATGVAPPYDLSLFRLDRFKAA
jgi:sarcosine oxidase